MMASFKHPSLFSKESVSCEREPSLEELFAEPIVQLFMARDQVDPKDIRNRLLEVIGLHNVGVA